MAKMIYRKQGLDCRLSSQDITNVKANAVVVGEAPRLDKDSLVTKTLIDKIPMFRERRVEFKSVHSFLHLWRVKHSYLGDTFEYVIHAVVDKGDNEIWVKNMMQLYHRVFKQAENISATRIALPLLGTGVAATADSSLAVRALVASILSYNPRGHLTIIVVSKDKQILDETETQFLYQRQYPEKQKGIIERASMFITEVLDPVPHRSTQPPERNAYHEVDDNVKNKDHTRLATDKELQQVLKQSAQEAKINVKPVHHQERSETRDHYNDRQFSNSSFSKEEYDLQRAIELSKKETGSVASPGPTPVTAATLRENTTIGDEITCPICLCCISDPKQLEKCGHLFCRDCIERSFRDFKPVCPSCNMVYGLITGNQPHGLMDVGFSGEYLPGYETYGTITITYSFPNGRQKAGDPSPGQPYKGTTRHAFLPANTEGKEILALLKTAFERRLTFTIGRSTTTGQDGVVTWNDIHHKTNVYGGPTRYGYPDPTYLSRVRDELASKGVTRSTRPSSSRQQTPHREMCNITLKELAESSNNHVKGNRKTYEKHPKDNQRKMMYTAEPNQATKELENRLVDIPSNSEDHRKDDESEENASDNSEPEINEDLDLERTKIDSVEDDKGDQFIKEDFQVELPKERINSSESHEKRRFDAHCAILPSIETRDQKHHSTAEQGGDSTKNTKDGKEIVDEDLIINDLEDASFSMLNRTGHDSNNFTEQTMFLTKSENELATCGCVEKVESNGFLHESEKHPENREINQTTCNQGFMLKTQFSNQENISESESKEVKDKKSFRSTDDDDDSSDMPRQNPTPPCTSVNISEGTGYPGPEGIQEDPRENQPGQLFQGPLGPPDTSREVHSDSSESFEVIASTKGSLEDVSQQTENSSLQTQHDVNGPDGQEVGDNMTHTSTGYSFGEDDLQSNGVDDSGHSFEIIEIDHNQEDQPERTTTEESINDLQESPEGVKTIGKEGSDAFLNRSDGNRSTLHDVTRGNQPDGQMDVGFSGEYLPGYEGHGTITITYYFPSGTQRADDPNPGQTYKGTTRRAYLPDSTEGKDVLKLLQRAFKRKLTFTIAPSLATGQENVVHWSDISHKTSKDGGPERQGYPDSTYLQRVKDELAGRGLMSDSQEEATYNEA